MDASLEVVQLSCWSVFIFDQPEFPWKEDLATSCDVSKVQVDGGEEVLNHLIVHSIFVAVSLIRSIWASLISMNWAKRSVYTPENPEN